MTKTEKQHAGKGTLDPMVHLPRGFGKMPKLPKLKED